MARGVDAGGRVVYRPVFARVLLVLFAVLGLWWDADLLLRGRPGQAVLSLLWLAAVCAVLAALFWRPAVVVDDDGAELRNILRDIRVPWASLEAVETRYALTLTAGGRRYTSWAGASSGRPPRVRASQSGTPEGRLESSARHPDDTGPASRHVRTASGASAFMIEQRWDTWQQAARTRAFLAAKAPGAADAATAAPPRVVVRWRPHLLGAAAVAAALAGALTPLLG